MTAAPTNASYHPWTTYVAAREEARQRGDRRVGTEHLVLALLSDSEIGELLGTTLETAQSRLSGLDRDALEAIGLALEVQIPLLAERELPSRPTIRAVLDNRIKMTPAAKGALQEAGKPMRRGEHISARQVLGAVVENRPPDPGTSLLTALGVDLDRVRKTLRDSVPT